MTAELLINHNIAALTLLDSIDKALRWMEELHLPYLPLVDAEGHYQGLIQEDILLNALETEDNLENIPFIKKDTFVNSKQHFFEILKLSYISKIPLIAVIEEGSNKFLGAIAIQDAVSSLAGSYALQEEGGVVIISMGQQNYSLAEISRLVESNNARVLGAFVSVQPDDPYRLWVTLKINQADLSRIVATFERFSYQIEAKFYNSVIFDDIDQSRLDMLLKYLDM